MAESTLSLTFNQLADEVGAVLNLGRDHTAFSAAQAADVAAIINRALRQFYYPTPLPGERSGYSWSFLHPVTTITTTVPYSTGTVGVALGVVTLASGTFPSWAAGQEITISGTTYTVNTRDSNTQVTLTDLTVTVTAGTSYALAQVAYDAPADFGGIRGNMTYATNVTDSSPLVKVDEYTIRNYRAFPDANAYKPRMFAVRTKAFVTTGQRYELLFYPTPDAAYTLTYAYDAYTGAITTTQYPLGGMAHAETILASCLDIAAQYLKSNEQSDRAVKLSISNRNLFLDRLAASISQDRGSMVPDHLGPNLDRSDGRHWSKQDQLSAVTYQNVLYTT